MGGLGAEVSQSTPYEKIASLMLCEIFGSCLLHFVPFETEFTRVLR